MDETNGSKTSKCVALLAEEVQFDVIAPHLVTKGIISERRKDEYLNSLPTNTEKFSMLVLELSEQGPDIQLRFLQILDKYGYRKTALVVQSYFGVELSDSSPASVKNCVAFDVPGLDYADGCVADGCVSSKPAAADDDEIEGVVKPVAVKHGKKFYSSSDYKIYHMGSKPKGHALVIVNQDFDDNLYDKRIGAESDRRNLLGLFQGLGFTVHEYFNKTAGDMRSILKKFAQLPEHKSVDSCIVAISSHGETNRIVGTDNEYLWTEDILDHLNNENCPHLMCKPKLFFFQACRGHKYDGGVLRNRTFADGGNSQPQTNNHKLLQPQQRSSSWNNMIIAYSTIPEYVAMRNEIFGSWFILAVTRIFSEHAWNTSLFYLFNMVAEEMEKYQTFQGEKQTPEIAHRGWKKDLYFNPGLYHP